MLPPDKLQSATSIIIMWVDQGLCSCKIEDYMNTDPQWVGITEEQIIAIASENGRVCAICNEKANKEYKASKVPFAGVLNDLKAIQNEAKSISQSSGSQGSKGSGSKKPPIV